MKAEKNCLDCINFSTPKCPHKENELFNKAQSSPSEATLVGGDISVLAELAEECVEFKPLG